MNKYLIFLTILISTLNPVILSAQVDRAYDPVVMTGSDLPDLLGLPTDNWRAFQYDATSGNWQEAPLQIDEYNPDAPQGLEYFEMEADSAGIFDADDEIVFMARDLGDIAPIDAWPTVSDTVRYEITVSDSVDDSQSMLYLIRDTSLDGGESPSYTMAFDSTNDVISSDNYIIGFDAGQEDSTGQLIDVRILSGTGEEIFDRMKLRLYAIVTILFPIPVEITENAIHVNDAFAKVGPVRIIRNLDATFKFEISGFPLEQSFLQTTFFYPWSGVFSITGIPIDQLSLYADVIYARLSWDMNAAASGMTFYSEANPNGAIVDGSGDTDGVSNAGTAGQFEWSMVTGDPGTMLNIFHLPDLGDSRGIFYFDNTDDDTTTTGDPEDTDPYTTDSGDGVSYGENGFFVHQNIAGDQFDFIYMNYFLPPGMEHGDASELVSKINQPLNVVAHRQELSATSVAANNNSPKTFTLYPNYPNPFNASTVIAFDLHTSTRVQLDIVDVQGRIVNRLVDTHLSASNHRITWDGRDTQGQLLPSGVYMYRLQTNDAIAVQKLVMVK